jgi:hypothetical protein
MFKWNPIRSYAFYGLIACASGQVFKGLRLGSFREKLNELLSRGPVECTGDEAGFRLAINWVQHAIITAYENNCQLLLVKPAGTSMRLAAMLPSLG